MLALVLLVYYVFKVNIKSFKIKEIFIDMLKPTYISKVNIRFCFIVYLDFIF